MTAVTSRRAILAGIAAVPAAVIASPTLAKLPDEIAVPKPIADAKLIELGQKLEQAVAEARAFDKGPMAKAHRLYEKLCTVKRPEPWITPMPAKIVKTLPAYPKRWGGQPRKDLTVVEYLILKKYRPNHPAVRWTDESIKDGDKRRAPYIKASAEAAKKSGVTEAEEKSSALWDRCQRVYGKIIREPAHSIAGLQIKVRATELVGDADSVDDSPIKRVWLSAAKDIARLTA